MQRLQGLLRRQCRFQAPSLGKQQPLGIIRSRFFYHGSDTPDPSGGANRGDTLDGTSGVYRLSEADSQATTTSSQSEDEANVGDELQVAAAPAVNRTKPHRVVFSGGPCAGKTTAMALLSDRLEAMGFRVLRVPEAATIMINSGVSFERDPNDAAQSQVSLMKMQMVLEDAMVNNAYNEAASAGRPCVVIMDRGCLDGKAYCGSDEEWQEVVRRATADYQGPGSYTEEALRDERYDQVILMTTAADGADEFYTCENNAARSESPEEAVRLDKAIQHAWLGHSCLTVVKNNTNSFAHKMARAVAAVTNQLGVPKSQKARKKYAFFGDFSVADLCTQKFLVEEVYLRSEPGKHCRIRKRRSLLASDRFIAPSYKLRNKTFRDPSVKVADDAGEGSAKYLAVSADSPISENAKRAQLNLDWRCMNEDHVVEESELLSFEQYNLLLKLADPSLLRTKKIRTHFIYNRTHFELDEWLWPPAAKEAGLKVLIIEASPEEAADDDAIVLPPGLLQPGANAKPVELLDVTSDLAWSTRAIVAGSRPWE